MIILNLNYKQAAFLKLALAMLSDSDDIDFEISKSIAEKLESTINENKNARRSVDYEYSKFLSE